MNTKTISAQEGNIFENENQVINPAAAEATQQTDAIAETPQLPTEQQPVFAVTKGNIGTAFGWIGELIAKELDDPKLHAIVEEVRAEPDEQKQKTLKEQHKFDIIGVCPHFSRFRNDHRTAADALPEYCTYDTCVDVDDRAFGQQAIEGALRLNEQPGKWRNKVLYIENSLRGGGKCHIWLRQPVGMTAIETQKEFCEALGIPCDDAVQQKQSFIYMTGDAVYQSPLWLKPFTADEIDARQTAFRLRGLSIDGWDKETDSTSAKAATADDTPVAMPADTDITAPTSRTDYIFETFWRKTGLEPSCISTDGKCHNSVKSLLSTGIVSLLTKSEMQGQLRQRTPDYWKCHDCQRLLDDFYTKYNDPSRALTREQRHILAISESMNENNTVTPDDKSQQQPNCDELTLTEIYASPLPPRMNRKKMPRLVKAVTSRTPDENKECVSQACFPPLQAHPQNFSARYNDNRYRQLRNGCVTAVDTGIGKSCIDKPIDHIMADVESVTAEERKKETTYHQNYNTRNSNVDKPKRPKFRIRNLMANLTPAALVLRTADNAPAPLYCKMNELEQWDKIENASGTKNQFTVMKINDDEGNQFGAERAGTQSVTAATTLFLNWNASTTPGKLVRYFRHVMTDGPISRLTMATIPDPGIGADIPVFGEYDEHYDAMLKPYIDNLNAATGQIDCRQARQMIKELKAECDEFAIASGDRVFDNLTHRALVHVFRKAICIYAANGMKWENSIKSFCRWSLHYDLWLKLKFFGDYIREADKDAPASKHGPRNMLELLNEEFTFTDLSNLRFTQGKDREGTANQLYQWVHRGLVLHLTDDRYKKAPKK